MIIKDSRFIASSVNYSKCPPPKLPEYAFIGRSNVGKSSLINSLVQRKSLALTSGSPGKTQTINHFLIDNSWFLVDLPGYGYAKTSKTERAGWGKMIEDYLNLRPNLVNTFALIDSRLPPQRIDLDFLEMLGLRKIPFEIVFTKIDKQPDAVTNEHVETYKKALSETWGQLPKMHLSSSVKNRGRDEILKAINLFNEDFGKMFRA